MKTFFVGKQIRGGGRTKILNDKGVCCTNHHTFVFCYLQDKNNKPQIMIAKKKGGADSQSDLSDLSIY